jgi:predicted RNA-binding protein (virulence factor B family)
MSQGVEIAVAVQGLAELFRAFAEAGAEYRAQRTLETADGKVHEVDYVATDAEGATVGVRVDAGTEKAVFVPQDCEAGKGRALAGRVTQAYARSRVLAELERKGYRVAREEKQRDGSVRLLLTRWR